jgi:outer membrane protein TolC
MRRALPGLLLALLLAPVLAGGAEPPSPAAPAPAPVPAPAPAPPPAPTEPTPAVGPEAAPAAQPLGPDELVRIALRDGGPVKEAEAKVDEWRGRLAEVESIFYPKLVGMLYAAPMYRVTGGPFEGTESDYRTWGPYLHLEAVLEQPLYTFGRAAAGEKAARERVLVEEARVRQTRNAVALEVRKLYFLHLYAKSLRPALESARKLLDQALATAREEHEKGSGKVTNVDLQKLTFGSSQLDGYRIQARIGEELSLAALKHALALPQEAALVLADERLPEPPPGDVPPLGELFKAAADARPEWAQLRHGKTAALSLADAERLANAPVVFAAGQLRADWAPTRTNVKNPYFYDPYNGVTGGVAVGLLFDLDPARAAAKGAQADALGEQVDALAAFAATGIPLEVRKARDDLAQATELFAVAGDGSVAARKWMIFAGTALATGTGEAKDVLEGLVSYLTAKKTEYEALRDLHVARAYLLYATGRTEGAP